jgi:anaerobic dimethyl sulfoxide reductase subunit C
MDSNEWPLVFFTLLSQISVGIITAALLVFLFQKNSEFATSPEIKKLMLTIATLLMGVALILSFLHLARPLHSVYALGNLGNSFLSREILMVSLYFVLLILAWASSRFGIPGGSSFNYIYVLACLSGIVLIYTMAHIYMIPTVPAWNTPLTFVKFFNSALLPGACALMLIMLHQHTKGIEIGRVQHVMTILFGLVVAGVLVHLFTILVASGAQEISGSSFPLPVIPQACKIARLALLLLGFMMILLWYTGFVSASAKIQHGWAYLGFLLLFLAEICGRYIFYASYYRLGV